MGADLGLLAAITTAGGGVGSPQGLQSGYVRLRSRCTASFLVTPVREPAVRTHAKIKQFSIEPFQVPLLPVLPVPAGIIQAGGIPVGGSF